MINKNSNNIAIQGFGLFSILFLGAAFLMSPLHAQVNQILPQMALTPALKRAFKPIYFMKTPNHTE